MAAAPKHIFLIDGVGALVTATLLLTVVAPFEEIFGIPHKIVFVLAAIAGVFALYSLSCHFLLSADRRPFLRLIALLNLGYCLLTATLIGVFSASVTLLGIAYFTVEILIVSGLAVYELVIVRRAADR